MRGTSGRALVVAAALVTGTLAGDLAQADGDAATDQVARLFPYSGELERDGRKVSGELEMTFSLHDGSASGDVVWFETQAVTLYGGRFSVLLGHCDQPGAPANRCSSGDADALVSIADAITAADDLYLKVSLDTGVEVVPMAQAKRFSPVPYAQSASKATNLDVANQLTVSGDTVIGALSAGSASLGSATVSGALSAQRASVSGVTETNALKVTTTELDCVWTDCLDTPVAEGLVCSTQKPGYPIMGGIDIATHDDQRPSRCSGTYHTDEVAVLCCRFIQP